jgi:hypothetical protein
MPLLILLVFLLEVVCWSSPRVKCAAVNFNHKGNKQNLYICLILLRPPPQDIHIQTQQTICMNHLTVSLFSRISPCRSPLARVFKSRRRSPSAFSIYLPKTLLSPLFQAGGSSSQKRNARPKMGTLNPIVLSCPSSPTPARTRTRKRERCSPSALPPVQSNNYKVSSVLNVARQPHIGGKGQ